MSLAHPWYSAHFFCSSLSRCHSDRCAHKLSDTIAIRAVRDNLDTLYFSTASAVSDTASNDASTDRTGPQLKALLQSAEHARSFEVAESTIVPDDVRLIQGALERWSTSGRIRLCITTGGTGFSPRDVTPEAVRPLIVREATGLQHLMLRASLDKTPMAALGRPVAGITKDGMVVVTLPGSPKGALENLEALLGVLPHALDLASGGSGVQVHNAMGVPSRGKGTMDQQHHSCSHSHSHSHTHGHHAPQPRTLQSMDPAQGGEQLPLMRRSSYLLTL